MDKLIITAAITGSRIPRSKTPHIPITTKEITRSAIECWEEGASIVHIHVRDPETQIGTQDIALFRQVVEPLREETDLRSAYRSSTSGPSWPALTPAQFS
jgi:uncharacterized protein (DUF849 family)